MRVLYVFPAATNQGRIAGFEESLKDGSGPRTLLLGAESMGYLGIGVSILHPKRLSIPGRFFLAIGIRWDPVHEAKALSIIGHYDVCAIKDLATAPILGMLSRLRLLATPLVYLDVVISESTPLKRFLGWLAGGAGALVYCSPGLHDILVEDLAVSEDRIELVPWAVDVDFWKPSQSPDSEEIENRILSVGFNDRDYGTLLTGISGLDVTLEIVTHPEFVPSGRNALVHVLSPRDLKQAYERAAIVAVPLEYNCTASGITSILEAMAMSKPVVTTTTPATEYYSAGGKYAKLVAPGQPQSLRQAVLELLADPQSARRLGAEARKHVETRFNIARQTSDLARLYRKVSRGVG